MRFFHWRIFGVRVDGAAYWHYSNWAVKFPTRFMIWRDKWGALCFIFSVLGTGFSANIE